MDKLKVLAGRRKEQKTVAEFVSSIIQQLAVVERILLLDGEMLASRSQLRLSLKKAVDDVRLLLWPYMAQSLTAKQKDLLKLHRTVRANELMHSELITDEEFRRFLEQEQTGSPVVRTPEVMGELPAPRHRSAVLLSEETPEQRDFFEKQLGLTRHVVYTVGESASDCEAAVESMAYAGTRLDAVIA